MKTALSPVLLLLLLSAACAPSPQEQAGMTASAQTALAQAWTTTPSPTMPPTSTHTPPPTETTSPTPSPTRKPTPTSTYTPTPEPGRHYATDNTFSLILPVGWQTKDVGLGEPGLFGPSLGDFSPNLIFIQERSLFPVDFYAAMVQDSLAQSLTDLKQIGEDFLVTEEGQDYFRWEMENTVEGVVYRQVLYFFESGDWKLVVTYTRPADKGEEADPMVEEAMHTLRYKH